MVCLFDLPAIIIIVIVIVVVVIIIIIISIIIISIIIISIIIIIIIISIIIIIVIIIVIIVIIINNKNSTTTIIITRGTLSANHAQHSPATNTLHHIFTPHMQNIRAQQQAGDIIQGLTSIANDIPNIFPPSARSHHPDWSRSPLCSRRSQGGGTRRADGNDAGDGVDCAW
eukprot:767233-Hanusia_phi.AAC.1